MLYGFSPLRDSQDLFFFLALVFPSCFFSGETQHQDNFNSVTLGATGESLQTSPLQENISRCNLGTD